MKLYGGSKADKRRLIVRIIEIALEVLMMGVVILGLLWGAGYFAAKAAPVAERVLWAAYRATMK